MSILISEEKLALLLEKRRESIERPKWDGLDTLISAISLGLSAGTATYAAIGPVSEIAIKVIFIILSIVFGFFGLVRIIKSVRNRYTHEALLNDIKSLNEINHPFSLVAIRNPFEEYSNRYLLYYDDRWRCWLFPNYRTKQVDSENEKSIRENLSRELKVAFTDIRIEYKSVQIHRKFSYSNQKEKVYEHKLYAATVSLPPERDGKFEIDGRKHRWMTKDEMLRDKTIRDKNAEVVNYVCSEA